MIRSRMALRGIILGGVIAQGCGDAASSAHEAGSGATDGATTQFSATTEGGETGDPVSSTGVTSTHGDRASTESDGDDGSGFCTDGVIDDGEQCDDGNMVDGDGCNNDCIVSGSLLWEHTHASGLGATDEASGVTLDAASDATVVGWVATEATGEDIWLRRYGAPGSLLWTRTVDGPASGNDRARDVAQSPDGSLFIAGHVASVSASHDIWVARYDAGGNAIWALAHDGPASGNDQGLGVATDGTGAAIVTGFQTVTYWLDEFSSVNAQDIWVRKYDAAGNVVWTAGHGGAVLGNDAGLDVAADSAGNVVVVGYETVSGAGRNMWIRKYDPSGGVLWTRTHDGPDAANDEATAVDVDVDDEILVAGFEGASEVPWRWFLRRYDAEGTVMWTRTWEGSSNEGARATGVSASGGMAVVTGVQREEGHDHIVIRKYGPDGFDLWTTTVRGIDENHHVSSSVALGDDGRSYVVGGLDKGVDGRDAWIGRFAQ